MTGFVYAIGGDDAIKVGWSSDPCRRLAKLASDCPSSVRLLGLVPATRAQEAELHTLFAPWRIRREWFRVEGPVLAFVEMLPKPQPRPTRPTQGGDHPLAIWRKNHGISMDDLAAQLGTSRAAVSRWESLDRMPRPSVWPKIRAVTGVGAPELASAHLADLLKEEEPAE